MTSGIDGVFSFRQDCHVGLISTVKLSLVHQRKACVGKTITESTHKSPGGHNTHLGAGRDTLGQVGPVSPLKLRGHVGIPYLLARMYYFI